MNFKPGDLVWVIYDDGRKAAEVIGELGAHRPGHHVTMIENNPSDFPGGGGWPKAVWDTPVERLRPRREPLGSWDTCVWRPKEVSA